MAVLAFPALASCPSCGNVNSDYDAAVCPTCGDSFCLGRIGCHCSCESTLLRRIGHSWNDQIIRRLLAR